MPNEVLSLLKPQPKKFYIDATFGAGGHSKLILDSCSACNVIGIDRDESVIPFADNLREVYKERFNFINSRFSNISNVIPQEVDGFLFDVGVSSMQINDPERGFSFMRDGPLKMTMGQNNFSAYDVINKYREEHLSEIILQYGDERAAPKIARAICHSRKNSPIETTLQLADIIKSVVPRSKKIHPATLTFQAIRVFINEELTELEAGLESAIEKLSIAGKIVVITFQGLENKIVKNIFKKYTYREHQNKFKVSENKKSFKNLTNTPLKPSKQEIRANPRARSAKIRSMIRLS